jgi:hypothetical protein
MKGTGGRGQFIGTYELRPRGIRADRRLWYDRRESRETRKLWVGRPRPDPHACSWRIQRNGGTTRRHRRLRGKLNGDWGTVAWAVRANTCVDMVTKVGPQGPGRLIFSALRTRYGAAPEWVPGWTGPFENFFVYSCSLFCSSFFNFQIFVEKYVQILKNWTLFLKRQDFEKI